MYFSSNCIQKKTAAVIASQTISPLVQPPSSSSVFGTATDKTWQDSIKSIFQELLGQNLQDVPVDTSTTLKQLNIKLGNFVGDSFSFQVILASKTCYAGHFARLPV